MFVRAGRSMAYRVKTPKNRASRSRWFRRAACAGTCLLVFATQACHKTSSSAPVKSLTLMDQTWVSRDYQRRLNGELALFTRQTGIRVEFLPGPETTTEQLATYRKLLEAGAKVPDVYGVDVIWPGILAENLLDLKGLVPATEIATHFPELIANNTVHGK